jgi:uncharacterized protein (TIGR02246 family)
MISSGPLDDRLAIRELVESYNDAVMRLDVGAWASNWADDAVWSLPGMGEVRGKDKIVAMWQQAMAALVVDGFFASAGPIVVDGDGARATWYQQEFLRRKDGPAELVIGEYQDEYAKAGGRWYFTKRVYGIRTREERPTS